MGKDLKGNELGKGIYQRKEDGLYVYRATVNKKRIAIYAPSLEEIQLKIKDFHEKCDYIRPIKTKIPIDILMKMKSIKRIETDNEKIKSQDVSFGYLYFLTDGDYVKIGVSKNVNKRISELNTSSAKEIKLIAKYCLPNPYSVEAILHQLLKRYRVNGEWFDISHFFV